MRLMRGADPPDGRKRTSRPKKKGGHAYTDLGRKASSSSKRNVLVPTSKKKSAALPDHEGTTLHPPVGGKGVDSRTPPLSIIASHKGGERGQPSSTDQAEKKVPQQRL